MDSGNTEAAKNLFSRCLLTCLNVDLWRTYIRFILRIYEPLSPEGIPEIKKAYEFSLDYIGQDLRSGPLWQEYISFLESPKQGTASFDALFGNAPEGQEESQRAATLRRAYHRALLVPTAVLDSLWSGYEKFENSTGNKTLAKRSLDEWRPRFQSARALVKDRAVLVDKLDYRALPLPPGRGGIRQARQAAAWRDYVAWERKNKQRLEHSAYQARVVLAYDQAMCILLQYPEMWLDMAAWHAYGGGAGDAAAKEALHRGRTALPTALMLHFAAADAEEHGGAIDAARAVYEELVTKLAAIEGEQHRTETPTDTNTAKQEENNDGPEKSRSRAMFSDKEGTLIWVHYMRFTKRVDGIMAARKLFLRARKWRSLGWEAFVASALIEWSHEPKDQIPRNIFELGLKTFLTEPGYVLQYAYFLKGLGDMTNLRALFERALSDTSTGKDRAAVLWDAYLQTEYEAGTLSSALVIESRRRAALYGSVGAGNGEKEQGPSDVARVALLKYRYLDMWPGNEIHLRSIEEGDEPGPVHAMKMPGSHVDREMDVNESGMDGRPRGRQGYRQQSRGGGRGGHRPAPPPPGFDPNEPIRQFPREIGQLIDQLSSQAVDGPVPDIDQVIEVILNTDFSLDGIDAHEVAASKERRRQRIASGRGMGGASGAPAAGVAGKRKLEDGGLGGGVFDESDSGGSDDDEEDDMDDVDVYRRRMRARV